MFLFITTCVCQQFCFYLYIGNNQFSYGKWYLHMHLCLEVSVPACTAYYLCTVVEKFYLLSRSLVSNYIYQ